MTSAARLHMLGVIGALGIFLVASPPLHAQQTQAAEPVCRGDAGYSADFEGRRTFLWRPGWLQEIKASAESDPSVMSKIRRSGDQALTNGPYSVTDKPKLPPDAALNDYASIGPYWWPNPKKRSGHPYIRKDGQVNPERNGPEFDKDRLRSFSNNVRDLALAYYVTVEEAYAEHAAKLLRTWFITPETRMNPHFNFAQGIPGKVNGRAEGIIESSHLSTIVEAVGLLQPSAALSAAEHRALRKWYGDFAVWMATSEIGAAEMKKTNNHGLYYDFYLAHFALYAGEDAIVGDVARAFPKFRLAGQMDSKGRFIRELKRTRSWHYSVFAVEAGARLATIAECADVDLWNARLDDGRSLQTAQTFLTSFSGRLREWPYPERDLERGDLDKMQAKLADLTLLFPDGNGAMDVSSLP